MKLLWICLFSLTGVAAAAPIVVHAHRGAMVSYPENTIAAFKEGIRAGADYIELDVLATRDNALVVAHDPVINLKICQGPGSSRPIRAMTLAEVRQYDCGSLTLPAFPRQKPVPGARIPTLDEVLALAGNSKVKFNIEIKSTEQWKDYAPEPEEFARMVVAAIRKHQLEERVLVQSFDFRVVKAVRAAAPDLTVAALYGSGDRSFVEIARETGVGMVNPNYRLVTREKIAEAHQAGIQVMAWTPDTPAEWDRLIEAGVDGIITNDPAGLIAHLKKRGLRP